MQRYVKNLLTILSVTNVSDLVETGAGVRIAESLDAIRRALPQPALYEMRLPGEIRERALAIFDRTFAITYVLEAVAVLIGLIGIAASISTQVLARRAEFGVLRHLGFTRRQIGSLLALEGVGLGCVGVVCGWLSGIVIGLILIDVVNRQSFLLEHGCARAGDVDAFDWRCVCRIGGVDGVVWSGRRAMSADVIAAVKEDW